ncbi:hypothetical protein NS341_13465, partial [Staphylococcus xylosus]
MPRREAHAQEIADEVAEPGHREPCAILGAAAAHLGDHDVGAAAGEGEDDLRRQHLAQEIADERAASDQLAEVVAEARAVGAVAAGFGQCPRDEDGHGQ